jgi:signal transduction histidine kinase
MEHGRQLIGDRSIRLQVVEAEIEWRTDPALLTQALLNLLRNAVEAISKEGEVRIEAQRTGGDEVSIAVTDTGAGIADEAIGRPFDPFFTTKASGTGLGLAITRRVVAALGGEVALRRRPEGGTEALIRIHAPAIGKTVAV